MNMMNILERYGRFARRLLISRTTYLDNFLGDVFFFKGKQLCIPKLSKRNSLIKEWHGPGLSWHFVQKKTQGIFGGNILI